MKPSLLLIAFLAVAGGASAVGIAPPHAVPQVFATRPVGTIHAPPASMPSAPIAADVSTLPSAALPTGPSVGGATGAAVAANAALEFPYFGRAPVVYAVITTHDMTPASNAAPASSAAQAVGNAEPAALETISLGGTAPGDGASGSPEGAAAIPVATAAVGPGIHAPSVVAYEAEFVVGIAVTGMVWAMVGMYHRIEPTEALSNPTRARVREILQAQGRASVGEVAAVLDLHPKTVRYHLDLLVSLSHAIRDEDGQYRLPGVKVAPEASPDDRILALIAERPGITATDVSRALGLGKTTAQERVTRLLLAGRLESRRVDRARLLFPGRGAPMEPAFALA
ncbi:MAG: helix-turn-helix domain-containing protein [Thermoplasmatota archaeon]